MLIIKTNYEVYKLNISDIKLIGKAGKGTSLRNLLKFKKDEVILGINYK